MRVTFSLPRGARCGKAARRDLRGGREVIPVPTATQERREHCGDNEHPGRQRLVDRVAPIEVPEQPRRARSPGHQANRAANVGVQELRLRSQTHCGHRDHAHDPQGAVGLPRRASHVRRRPVLFAGCLIRDPLRGFADPRVLIAAEPERALMPICTKNGLEVFTG